MLLCVQARHPRCGLRGVKLALYTTSWNAKHAVVKLQRVLDALPEGVEKERLAVKVAKTHALALGIMKPTPMYFMGEYVRWAPSVKYLGVTNDRSRSVLAPSSVQAHRSLPPAACE